jgi:serine/threonine-protein kinase HipA
MTRRFDIELGDVRVGQLVELQDGRTELRMAPNYLRSARRPVLGQYFEDQGATTYRSRPGGTPLPAFFAHDLPEGALREALVKAHGLDPGDDLGLLAAVGSDLPGAVRVHTASDEVAAEDETPATTEELERSSSEPGSSGGLRFSLAGVQLKFSVVRDGRKLVLPARGRAGEWIVKLPDPSYPGLCENEWSVMTWARGAGFDVPECYLHPATDVAGLPEHHVQPDARLFAIRRYDRGPGGTRIHQEDFAQVVNQPARQGLKYEHVTYEELGRLIFNVVDERAFEEYLRRLVFVIASGNADAHLKNWSLIYPDGMNARLSPMYDQVATVAWPQIDARLGLKLASVRDFGRVDVAALRRLADRAVATLASVERHVEEVLSSMREVWAKEAGTWPMLPEHADRVREHWSRVPLLRDFGSLE